MVRYRKNEAREWARENMHGMCNVVIPSYSLDLKRLNEKGIRHDIRKELEYGFWATLLVSEVAITVEEYRQFVRWSHEEAQGKLVLVHHAAFNTLEENIEAVEIAEKEGCELVLLVYPQNFYATTESDIYEYTKKFCDATQLGVILFPVPHWGFERVHPAGMSPDLVKRMIREIPTIVCIKAESGMPTPAGFVQAWRNHSHEVVVTCPVEGEAFPLAGLVPIRFMGTSNYEFYGGLLPRMFKMVREGRFDEMDGALLEDQSLACRSAFDHGELHAGRGHSPSHDLEIPGVAERIQRRAAASAHDENPRRAHAQLRESLKRSGLDPTNDPDSEFFVGRNPV
jgi:4-hydroxy-tetrahydrodipicolinate synthase